MKKPVPVWLSTALSFVLVVLLFAAYLVSHAPKQQAVPEAAPALSTPVGVPAAPAVSYEFPVTSTPAYTQPLTIGTATMEVAYATTPAEQQQGLSDSALLGSDQGMLFIFPQENQVGFWMKDMNYPLDIIWIGVDKKVADITPNLSPSTYPANFSPKVPVLYVLEAPSGFAAQNHITVGTQVSF